MAQAREKVTKAYLVVADAARARVFSWQDSEDVSLDGYPRLRELDDLANPEARLQDREVFSNEITNNRTTGPGQAHSKDDHRDAHRRESLRRFVREVTRCLSGHVLRDRPSRVILVSEKQLLHELRRGLEPELPRDILVNEVAENLAKASATELHATLARKGFLPALPKGPTPDQFVPRGQPTPGAQR